MGGDGSSLITRDERGLYCAAGGFHIDPWAPVERAVVTHAHSDHATWGCGEYLTVSRGVGVLGVRVGAENGARIEGIDFGERRRIGDVLVSLHPAGHILGSAQVRVEAAGPAAGDSRVWVVSGDYATMANATCDAFEPVRCDVFLTESTFGLPVYRWPEEREELDALNAWWRANREAGATSVVLAYALGKAQRVLAGVDPSIGPIGVHGAVMRFEGVYEGAGIALPRVVHASEETAGELKGKGLIVAPPSVLSGTWLRRFRGPEGYRTAFASGWMAVRGKRRWRNVDRGFVLSDHADWDGLNEAIEATGAGAVGVTHGYAEQLARWRAERGQDAFVVRTRYVDEESGEGDGKGEGGEA